MLFLTFGGGGVKGTAQVARDAKESSEATVNELVVAQLVQSIVTFELANGKAPEGVADLPGAEMGAFDDPWGNRLSFEILGRGGSREVVVRSHGPDGQAGTEDDVEVKRRMPI